MDEKIRKLMEMTGYGIIDCKTVIIKAKGNLEKARELLVDGKYPVYAMVTYSPSNYQNTNKD